MNSCSKAVEIYEGGTVMRKYYEIKLQICPEMAIIHNEKLHLKDTLVLIKEIFFSS